MNRRMRIITVLLGASVLAGVAFGPEASAQSANELRQENQRLRTRVQDLEKELEAARDRIAELEKQVEELRNQGRTRQPSDLPEEKRVSVDESQPDASPRALFRAIQKSYQVALGALDIGEEEETRERQKYLRELDRWRNRVMREFRMPVQWTVRFQRIGEPTQRGFAVEVQAVDPKYGTELGEPFWAVLPKARTDVVQKNGLDQAYTMRGTTIPQVAINPELESGGPFTTSRMVGPFAEYRLIAEISNVVPTEIGGDDANDNDDGDAGDGDGGAGVGDGDGGTG